MKNAGHRLNYLLHENLKAFIMKRLGNLRSAARTVRFFSVVFLVIVLYVCAAGGSLAEKKWRSDFEEERGYVAYPGNIPFFQNFTTPQIKPGGKGTLNFTVMSRYDLEIKDVRLRLEIYREARIDESKNLSDIGSPPYFLSSGNQSMVVTFGILRANVTETVREIIKARTTTREGTYFIRTSLSFLYNNTLYKMKSRGHFPDELWYRATSDGDDHEDTGAINLTTLGVDGIIPETTFGVRKTVAIWPIFFFGALTTLFAGLAIFVFLLEEEVYPQLNKRVEEQRRKLNELWFSLKDRKGKT